MERRQFLTTGVLGTLGLAACEADQNGTELGINFDRRVAFPER